MEVGTPSAFAIAEVPPKRSMIAETVINGGCSEFRNTVQEPLSAFVIYGADALRHPSIVLTTVELLDRLTARGVKKADIARCLNVHPSRVTEMWKGERTIKLDEAAKLVAQFDLESLPAQRVSPLPASIARLIVQYVSHELGARHDPAQLEELSQDIRAFAEFVADPSVRGSVESAEAFFQAMRLRRPRSEEADPPGTDHQPAK